MPAIDDLARDLSRRARGLEFLLNDEIGVIAVESSELTVDLPGPLLSRKTRGQPSYPECRVSSSPQQQRVESASFGDSAGLDDALTLCSALRVQAGLNRVFSSLKGGAVGFAPSAASAASDRGWPLCAQAIDSLQ